MQQKATDVRGGFAVDDRVSADGVQLVTKSLVVFAERRQLCLGDVVHRLFLLHSSLQHQHLYQTPATQPR